MRAEGDKSYKGGKNLEKGRQRVRGNPYWYAGISAVSSLSRGTERLYSGRLPGEPKRKTIDGCKKEREEGKDNPTFSGMRGRWVVGQPITDRGPVDFTYPKTSGL